jgi:hypothetical protein
MTPNHDHATLFVAPPAAPEKEVPGRPQSTVDHGAEAMRSLREPFVVPEAEEPATTSTSTS